ncbi:MAG: hypothetical protein ABI811_12470 [Acidobacteriota bacterium]
MERQNRFQIRMLVQHLAAALGSELKFVAAEMDQDLGHGESGPSTSAARAWASMSKAWSMRFHDTYNIASRT